MYRLKFYGDIFVKKCCTTFFSFFWQGALAGALSEGQKTKLLFKYIQIGNISFVVCEPLKLFFLIFNFIPHELKNQNHFKKSLHIWVLQLFSFAHFALKTAIIGLYSHLDLHHSHGYKICHANFPSTYFIL